MKNSNFDHPQVDIFLATWHAVEVVTVVAPFAHCPSTVLHPKDPFLFVQGLAKLLEDQHGYIDLQNIPENKYFSMSQSPNDDEEKI